MIISALPICLVIVPLADILGPIGMIISALPICLVIVPLAIVDVPVCVDEFPMALRQAVPPLTFKLRSVRPFLHAVAIPFAPSPLAGVPDAVFKENCRPGLAL